jgi:hypothetical protein
MNGVNHSGAYLEHVQAEHRHLNAALLEIRRHVAELAGKPQPPTAWNPVIAALKDLREELRSHFAEEEGGGCLDEASARSPSIGPEVNALFTEHEVFLQALDDLLARVESHRFDQPAWERQFEEFARRLQEHESAESRLLAFALGGEAAEYDIEGGV